MVGFSKAVRAKKKLRAALLGPAGSGKTRTALEMAKGMGGKVALIDSEHGSATMFADLFDFETLELTSFSPSRYVEAIDAAEAAGFDVLIIDSLSHAWSGKDGILEFIDRTKKNNNSFNAWGEATPMQNALVERLLSCKLHLIVTMRTKMEFVQEKDPVTGKTTVRKIGMQPVQRDGVEYEFDVICDIDQQHTLTVAKTRIDELDHVVIEKAGVAFGARIKTWLDSGATVKPPVTADQKARMLDLAKQLGVTEKPGAYLVSLNGGEKMETADQAAAVIAEMSRRLEAKVAAGPTKPTTSTEGSHVPTTPSSESSPGPETSEATSTSTTAETSKPSPSATTPATIDAPPAQITWALKYLDTLDTAVNLATFEAFVANNAKPRMALAHDLGVAIAAYEIRAQAALSEEGSPRGLDDEHTHALEALEALRTPTTSATPPPA